MAAPFPRRSDFGRKLFPSRADKFPRRGNKKTPAGYGERSNSSLLRPTPDNRLSTAGYHPSYGNPGISASQCFGFLRSQISSLPTRSFRLFLGTIFSCTSKTPSKRAISSPSEVGWGGPSWEVERMSG